MTCPATDNTCYTDMINAQRGNHTETAEENLRPDNPEEAFALLNARLAARSEERSSRGGYVAMATGRSAQNTSAMGLAA